MEFRSALCKLQAKYKKACSFPPEKKRDAFGGNSQGIRKAHAENPSVQVSGLIAAAVPKTFPGKSDFRCRLERSFTL